MHFRVHNNDFEILNSSLYYLAKLHVQVTEIRKNAQTIKCYLINDSCVFEFS